MLEQGVSLLMRPWTWDMRRQNGDVAGRRLGDIEAIYDIVECRIMRDRAVDEQLLELPCVVEVHHTMEPLAEMIVRIILEFWTRLMRHEMPFLRSNTMIAVIRPLFRRT